MAHPYSLHEVGSFASIRNGKLQVPAYFPKAKKDTPSEKWEMVSAGMEFVNNKKFRSGVPACTGQFLTLDMISQHTL
jgi:hypothetical protein